jgi:ubiquitin C-terminal hydrolase
MPVCAAHAGEADAGDVAAQAAPAPTGEAPPDAVACNSSSSRGANTYRLCGVITHRGELSSGHYIVYVWPPGAAGWYKCDDAWVTAATEEEVLSTQAYILFYVSRS